MNKILDAFAEYIDSIIEQKVANRQQFQLDPKTLSDLVDERVDHIMKKLVSVEDLRSATERAVSAHLESVGIDVDDLASSIADNAEFKDALQRMVKREMRDVVREVVRDEIDEGLGNYFSQNAGDLQQAVDNFFEDDEDRAAELFLKAICNRHITITIKD